MRALVIGNGLLGYHLVEYLPGRTSYTALYSHAQVDVTDLDSVKRAVDKEQPDVVINTAAFHQLAACERDPDRAFDVNARGADNVGKVAPQVFVSTDYVFNDGGPHPEVLPGSEPRSVYGRSKLAGEMYALGHGGIVVRVAGLFGHYRCHKGPTFPQTVLTDDAPLKVPVDQRFTPTYAVDAARRIADLAYRLYDRPTVNGRCFHGCEHGLDEPNCNKRPTGIYHATNLGGTTWADFAAEVSEIGRGRRHIIPVKAKDPLRPTDSRLVSTRLPELRHFRLALVDWSIRREAERVSPLRAGA